jgi:hypothetical protein
LHPPFGLASQFDPASRDAQVPFWGTRQKRKKEMNEMIEIAPIRVFNTAKRPVRCSKAVAPSQLSALEVRQMQAELTHLRFELKTLRQATQDLVRHLL